MTPLFTAQAETIQEKLVAIRRDFHMYPELSGEEERTAGIVADRLRALGLEVTTNVGGHGVIGLLQGSQPGPVVAWRADMDAFPSEIHLDVPYKSRVPGARHICGHDVHTTIGLGIAELLAGQREQLAGTIKFIFQPAEETATGARAVVADGALENPRPEAIFGLHVAPLPVGTIGSGVGMVLPGVTMFPIHYETDGATDEALQQLTEAILTRLRPLNDVPMDLDRIFDPTTDLSAFIALGGIPLTDDAGRIIGLHGLMRTATEELRVQTQRDVQYHLDDILATSPVKFTTVWPDTISLPATINDTWLEQQMRAVLGEAVGQENLLVISNPVPFNSEDFAIYLQYIPGVFYWLGAANAARGITGMPHTPDFDVDEDCIRVGVAAMSRLLLHYAKEVAHPLPV